ncbi:MAG: acyl-CoA thioester hydrolase/BAAT C-terminal domain-containing protein [Oscillospiraceae bacterium]|nr:acyl-CoA thioester hydrolase/BAAT C-terminal domain-containing protein [Oscillospiraceae bacterium]
MDESKTCSIEQDGFIGKLFTPENDRFPGKALVAFSGSDGRFELSCLLGQLLAAQGVTVLAIAYFNLPGLPDCLCSIPMEPVEKAAQWLKGAGYKKVGLWGISMGAELALLSGAAMPELISCVIAASPICFITQGFSKDKRVQPHSAFTWRGADLPYRTYTVKRFTKALILKSWCKFGDPGFRMCYEPLMEEADEKSVIPVEKIAGPVLLFSGGLDSMWPAKESADYLMRRLDESGFPYLHQHFAYDYGSHYMVPMHLKSERLFHSERKYKAESDSAKKDQLEKTMEFLHQW